MTTDRRAYALCTALSGPEPEGQTDADTMGGDRLSSRGVLTPLSRV